MCQFFSAVLTKNGDLLYNLVLNSHEEIIELFKIKDTQAAFFGQNFVRLEFVPDLTKNLSKPEAWTLKLDERETPEWYDPDKAQEKCWDVISGIVVSDERETLTTGHYILTENAVVKKVINSHILFMNGRSKVEILLDHGRVGEMWYSSKIGEMYDSSKVGEMWYSSKVGVMYDSSKVERMYDSSEVERMYDSSKVERMNGFSEVGGMNGFSEVGGMWGSSEVGVMYNSSKIEKMYSSSKIGEMNGSSEVESDKRVK
jgi:hypothetical protein